MVARLMMSDTVLAADAGDNRLFPVPAVPRALAICLAASVAFHVLVLLWLPGRHHEELSPPIPVLEVVLVARGVEVPVETPKAQPVRPQPVISQPARTVMTTTVPATPVDSSPARPPDIPAADVQRPTPQPVQVLPAPPADPSSPPLFNAAYLRNPAPAYPATARRSGDQGTVMLKVLVSPEGAPLRVELEQSSGSRSLDVVAQDAVKGWRFVPARRGAQNVEGWVRVPVVFKLES